MSVVIWLVVIVIVIATPAISSAITSGSMLHRAKVQSDVAQAIYDRTEVSVTVNCPQDPPLSPGSQFQCVAPTADGSTAMVTITIQDSIDGTRVTRRSRHGSFGMMFFCWSGVSYDCGAQRVGRLRRCAVRIEAKTGCLV